MKKLLVFLMIMATLFSLCACGGGDTKPTEESKPVITDVAEPYTQAMLDAIPIATADMTMEQLRQICVDFMRYQVTIPWAPSKEVYYNYSGEKYLTLPAMQVVGGMPYITLCQGSIYNFLHFYDESNGYVDMDAVFALGDTWEKIFGNQCSGATYWAWARVCNTVSYKYTSDMTSMFGCYPVGPHTIPAGVLDFGNGAYNTTQICKLNGEQVMYESYAAALPADGFVQCEDAGHVQMASAAPNVVRNADGTIDGEKSTITLLDQWPNSSKGTQSNGKDIYYMGGPEGTFTFAKLYEKGYLPFTFAEFLGTDPVEKGEVGSNVATATVTPNRLKGMQLSSNYPITNGTTTIKDAEGKVLYTAITFAPTSNIKKNFGIGVSLDMDVVNKLANGTNTVEIVLQIGTGEKLVAYSGTLVPNT